MESKIFFFKSNINVRDKFLIVLISLIPFALATSIFIADFFASLSSLILIYIFLKKEDIELFKSIKKEICFFLVFYLIILISLFLTEYKDQSFLASFFYFRYFFLSLALFYLLKKHEFFLIIFFNSLLISLSIVIIDGFIQYFLGYNIFGYALVEHGHSGKLNYLSGFFNEEKKLGSYLVRLLPLMLGLIYLHRHKISPKVELLFLILISVIIFLSSERTALLLLLIIYFFYFLINTKKILNLVYLLLILICLFAFNKTLASKYINFSLVQTGLITLFKNYQQSPINKDIPRYYSVEHENLSYTGLVIFKNNYLFGSGVKTFFQKCHDIKPKYQYSGITKRNNRLICSTHPHNTYVQILAEIGLFGFLISIFMFCTAVYNLFKIFFNKKRDSIYKAYFFANLCFIINLMPLIPSGSFFNNWMSLILFFPLGFWLYLKNKLS